MLLNAFLMAIPSNLLPKIPLVAKAFSHYKALYNQCWIRYAATQDGHVEQGSQQKVFPQSMLECLLSSQKPAGMHM